MNKTKKKEKLHQMLMFMCLRGRSMETSYSSSVLHGPVDPEENNGGCVSSTACAQGQRQTEHGSLSSFPFLHNSNLCSLLEMMMNQTWDYGALDFWVHPGACCLSRCWAEAALPSLVKSCKDHALQEECPPPSPFSHGALLHTRGCHSTWKWDSWSLSHFSTYNNPPAILISFQHFNSFYLSLSDKMGKVLKMTSGPFASTR